MRDLWRESSARSLSSETVFECGRFGDFRGLVSAPRAGLVQQNEYDLVETIAQELLRGLRLLA